jgi:alcohol dehydrogenase class IV
MVTPKIAAFALGRTPELHYGPGTARRLPELVARFGRKLLVVTGESSLEKSGGWARLEEGLKEAGLVWSRVKTTSEPSPALVDEATAAARRDGVEVVLAIGGGSALDAGKAISAMIPASPAGAAACSVRDYLEGLPGSRPHDGKKVPFVAAPTTAGTGGEATKNAVLSKVGPDGFKRSIRHDNLIPDVAVLDPELMTGCPAEQTAASGMDAFTQLLEGFVSSKASPITDTLAIEGMRLIAANLVAVCGEKSGDLNSRGAVALGAFCSGFVLAHAGLGIVHGLAGAIGGAWHAPHGMVCGTLLAVAVDANIEAMIRREPANSALKKYAAIGALLADEPEAARDVERGCELLSEELNHWTRRLPLKRLEAYGLTAADCDRLAARPDMKQNPIALTPVEVAAILKDRL